jgi:hypothetical protein
MADGKARGRLQSLLLKKAFRLFQQAQTAP